MALKNNFSYQNRLFFLIVAFTWTLALSFFILQYSREKEYKVNTLDSQLQVYNKTLINSIENDSLRNLDAVKRIVSADSMRVTILDFNGKVLFDTNGDKPFTNHLSRNEVKEALATGSGHTIRRQSESDSNDYFYSATKGDSLIVRSAIPYSTSLYHSLSIDSIYIWILLLMAITVTIIAYFASRRIGQSVKNLRDFATQAESGNVLSYDTGSFPEDELGEISKNIINLYKNLRKANQERDESMRNAIFEEQEKVRIKHQLTNNINHEIKTPVHAIQACLETIVNNRDRLDKDAIIKLIERAYDNVVRLCSLLRDVSVITRITEAGDQIKKSEVSINDILDEINDEMNLLPPEKQMRLNIDVPKNVKILGNESLIGSIFHNLVSNSLAYSGGRDIYIKLIDNTPEYYKFEFSDNGVGVSDEHISRLFERFYRVDEGRSRKMGGTGLGLAIVKNAVLFHHGTITVENIHSGGLKFTFTLHK